MLAVYRKLLLLYPAEYRELFGEEMTAVLRDEIHEILRHKKEVKTFVNQYHSSYGYGATEIYFQY